MMGFCQGVFIDKADAFARLRNAACHSGLFDRPTFDKLYREFEGVKKDAFPDMFRLKESLRHWDESPEQVSSISS